MQAKDGRRGWYMKIKENLLRRAMLCVLEGARDEVWRHQGMEMEKVVCS